jgi:hypothetical protein
MKQTLHLLFCRLAAAVAASWAVMLLVWPELSRWLPCGELPALHARCIGVLHLALACGLWSALRRIDEAAARMPLLWISVWGATAVATAPLASQSFAGQVWLTCMVLAAGCAVWVLLNDDGLHAPAERLDVAWAALALGTGAAGAALLLWPDWVAAQWPWRMAHTQAAAYGAPLLGIAAMAWEAARERRRYARQPALHACLALTAGLLGASMLHYELFVATRTATWVWFGVLITVAAWAAAPQVRLRAG